MNILTFEDSIYILGNQAADLDSTVSAFSLAALLEALNPGLRAFPLIQGSIDDLRLKPEIKALLKRAGISPDDESFISEDSVNEFKSEVILVDHNKPDYPGLEKKIAGIIDHHKDEGLLTELPLRIIRRTGSCATLIAELWRESGLAIPPTQSLLLLGALTVDTGNLNPEWGKTTSEDEVIYKYLSSFLNREDMDFILSLEGIKLDLSHLNLQDHLIRDYKRVPLPGIRAGISSIPLDVKEFFSPDFFDSMTIDSFMKLKDVNTLIIMHSISEPFSRQFSFYSPSDRDEIKTLHTDGTESMIFEALDELGGFTPLPSFSEGWHSFELKDPTVSRKVLTPRLQKILKQKYTGSLTE